jgi:hypothetical protein
MVQQIGNQVTPDEAAGPRHKNLCVPFQLHPPGMSVFDAFALSTAYSPISRFQARRLLFPVSSDCQ